MQMENEVEYITQEGLEEAKARLAKLKATLLEVGRIKSEAAAGGDWHDNPVFEEMTREEYRLYPMIAELEERIRRTKVMEPPVSSTRVGIGTRVGLRFEEEGKVEEYLLGGSLEADPLKQRISYRSPLGSAILGAEVGETVTYQVGSDKRKMKITIVSISAM